MVAFFDTSILVAGLIDLGKSSVGPMQLMHAVASGKVRNPATAWHCCLEFFAVSTRLPEEFRLSAPEAIEMLKSEVLSQFKVHQLPNSAYEAFLEDVRHDGISGGRIYDAHIAEIARATAAKIVVTENLRDFKSLQRHGIKVLDAAEFYKTL